jgi:DNA polymerase I
MKYSDTLLDTPILLIDADLYLYRAAAAAEEEINWGDDIWSLSTDLKVAKTIFQDQIQRICERLGSADFIMCISDRENFRREIASFYKSGRKNTRKPVGYAAFVQWCKETYRWHTEALLEADDVMGILASTPNSKAIIVSDDKDMKSVPCRLYRPASDELLEITLQDADRWFLTQALTGDPTDGYSGAKGVGIKTAEKILGPHPDWSQVVSAYAKVGMSEAEALQQARLARILRWSDWDETTSTIKLWSPAK